MAVFLNFKILFNFRELHPILRVNSIIREVQLLSHLLKGIQSLIKNFRYVKDFDPLSTVKVPKNSSDIRNTLKNAFEIQKLVLRGTYLASLGPD